MHLGINTCQFAVIVYSIFIGLVVVWVSGGKTFYSFIQNSLEYMLFFSSIYYKLNQLKEELKQFARLLLIVYEVS